jgi:hypothetical protein
VRLEDEDAKGLYDPGANVSLISTKFFKKLSGKKYIPKSLTYRTISGKEKIKGNNICFGNEKLERLWIPICVGVDAFILPKRFAVDLTK